MAIKAARPQIGTGTSEFGRAMSYEELQGVNNIIVASPETVTRKLTEIVERLSPGYIHI